MIVEEMRNEEMEQPQIESKITPKEEITPEEIEDLIAFFKKGYGERWVSDEHFRNVVMKNVSEFLRLYSEGKLAAAAGINVNRITDISVDPDQRGKGLGIKIFEEAARHNPNVWITVGVDAPEMISTITSQNLSFLPVEEKERIESLFRQINGVSEDFEINTEVVAQPLLSERLKAKGVDRDNFVAFSRVGSLHGTGYKQILFQNNG